MAAEILLHPYCKLIAFDTKKITCGRFASIQRLLYEMVQDICNVEALVMNFLPHNVQ